MQREKETFLLGLGDVTDPAAGARASRRCVDGDEHSIDHVALEVEVPTNLLEREKRKRKRLSELDTHRLYASYTPLSVLALLSSLFHLTWLRTPEEQSNAGMTPDCCWRADTKVESMWVFIDEGVIPSFASQV